MVRLLPLLLLAVAAACRPPAAEAPRHLILITFDTLRADHMSLLGYARRTTPELERFAESGVSFERAIAQWPKTGTSFASIWSGLYPQTTGLTHRAALDLPEDLLTLPQLLAAEGFTNVAVVSNPVLSRDLGWSRHFEEYLETWTDTGSNDPFDYRPQLAAPRVNELALPLLERHRDAERLFAWIHYSDPHAPYVLPPGRENPFLEDAFWDDTAAIVPDLEGTRGREIPGVLDLREYVALYDANVLEADRATGVVLERLAALKLLDDAAVVVTADHGESLGEHGLFFEHGPLAHNPGVHVPLVLAGPRLPAGEVVPTPVDLVDLLPTLCPWLAVPCPTELDGTSLWPALDGEALPSDLAFSEAGHRPQHLRSVQNERYKLVYHSRRRAPFPDPEGRFELFDLDGDPGETENRFDRHPEEGRRLQRALVDWVSRARAPTADESPLTPEQKRALDAMGYTQ